MCIRDRFATRIAALPEPEALKDAKTRLQEYLSLIHIYQLTLVTGAPTVVYEVLRLSLIHI